MEKEGINPLEFKPAKSVEITREGVEASLEELKSRAEDEPNLSFAKKLKHEKDLKVFLVGGSVRDAVLGLKSDDYDLLLEGVSHDTLQNYLEKNGRLIESSDVLTGTFKFLPSGQKEPVDLALPRIESYDTLSRKPRVSTDNVSLKEDLSRRDFTFNAVAVELYERKANVIDYFGGIDDIQHGTVRSVGDPRERFSEDPLRILRAIRFATRFDFEIEQDLVETIKELGKTIDQVYLNEADEEKRRVAYERVRKEVEKSMEVNPERFIELLDSCELLALIFPEVEKMKGVKQPDNYHAEGDVYSHTMLVLRNIPADSSLAVKLAALFHDAGKPDTFSTSKVGEDRITFFEHDKLSVDIAKASLRKLRFSNKVIEDVSWLIYNHMRIFSFTHMRQSKQKLLASNPLFSDLMVLAKADAMASKRLDGKEDYSFFEAANDVLNKLELTEGGKEYVEIISGHDIISVIKKTVSFSPEKHGILVGKIKKEVNDAYNNGEITDRNEALKTIEMKIEDCLNK